MTCPVSWQRGRLGAGGVSRSRCKDMRGVRIGADQRVRVGAALLGDYDLCQVLEVDLVADPGGGRHHPQVVERPLPPPQESVPLGVADELQLGVAGEGVGSAGDIDDHRVVDDQIHGHLGRHTPRVAAQIPDRVTHGSEIGDGRDAGEVLHEDPGRREHDLPTVPTGPAPRRQALDVARTDAHAVLVTQQVLQENLERERQRRHPEVVLQRRQPAHLEPPIADVQHTAGTKAVLEHHSDLYPLW